MKRSGIKPSSKPIARTGRPKPRREKPRRVSVDRDRGYLDWLKEQVCVACRLGKLIYRERVCASGSGPIDPCHGPVNGMGSKGADSEAIPLCRDHHIEQHVIGWPAFEERHQFSREEVAVEHYARYKAESVG